MADTGERAFWESARMNNYSFRQYYNRLVELSVSMFEWKNLPDTIDVRYLELALFGDGMAVFFKDDVLGYLALRCAIGGQMNVYRIPTMRRAYAANGYNKQLDETDSVIIFNNYLHTNSMLDVELFAAEHRVGCRIKKAAAVIAAAFRCIVFRVTSLLLLMRCRRF